MNPPKAETAGLDAEVMRRAWEARADTNPLYAIDARRRTWEMGAFYLQGPEMVAEMVDPVLQSLGVSPPGARVLDVGCGMGRFFEGLAQRFEEVWGIDISASMIELGREHCPVEATWLVGDGTSLAGIQDASVDHVLCYEVFEHIPRPAIIRSYLDEFRRVLKPGGTFQAQLRFRSDSARQSVVRHLPRPLRVMSGALLRKAGVLPVSGDIDTWLGSLVSPEEGLDMVQTIGFIDVAAFSALFNNAPNQLSPCFWIMGRKPNDLPTALGG
jgi:2-polyprenyl-3-methyl-5-hydroxy-6-metoxy-1,4-benzoquinol methylase